MPLLSGDIMIDSSNGERCQVNWVKDGRAGVSYLDEPWFPGAMVVGENKLISCEDEAYPTRYEEGWQRVKAAREQMQGPTPEPLSGLDDDALIAFLAE